MKSKEDDKYHVEYADGNEDHLTYADIINLLLNKETEDGYHLWTFKEILDHRFRKKNGKTFIQVKSPSGHHFAREGAHARGG